MKHALLALLLFLTGCNQYFRADTVLHSDGSVDRATTQPADIKHGSSPAALGIDDDRAERMAAEMKSGHYPTVDKIPDHLVIPEADEAKELGIEPSRLKRTYDKKDHVFVTTHEWAETLTDIVTWDGMKTAREQIVTELISLAKATADEAFGKEYDFSALELWAKTDLRAWIAETTDFLYVRTLELKASGLLDPKLNERDWYAPGVAAICGKHGLVLTKDGKVVDDPTAGQAWDTYIRDLLTKTIKRRDNGKPIEPETVDALMSTGKGSDEMTAATKRIKERFEAAYEKVCQERYGKDEDAFKNHFMPLAYRVAGCHYVDFLMTRRFNYAMTVPGVVIATNGQIIDDNRVRWQFEARMAWPNGYTMAVTSIEPNADAQKALLGGQPLKSRAEMMKFMELASGWESVLEGCGKQKSMKPLYDVRDNDGKRPAAVKELLQLLKLPAKQP